MVKSKKLISSIAVSLVFAGLVGSASAVSLTPGSGVLAPAEPDPVGATTVFSTNVSWGASFSFSGTLFSSVLTNDSSNPFGLNDLTFIYQFSISSNTGSTSHPGTQLSIGDFTTFLTDVSYKSGTGVVPFQVNRSGESPTEGDTVEFGFSQLFGFSFVSPGTNSATLVVQTDATLWQQSIASITDSSAFPNIPTLAPVDVVPEPTSFALFTFGVFGLAGVTYHKRQSRLKGLKQVSLPLPSRMQ